LANRVSNKEQKVANMAGESNFDEKSYDTKMAEL